ncbi:hypothetical protein, partial [Escherichia coli]|uniref:hypothetical protein n=1 Tax=Escherichia coli TaxID=562 RepID=UPI001CC9BC19
MYALQYSPRTAIVENAVVVELEASIRLFGGKRTLRDRMVAEVHALGVEQVAWSSTSLAALACARGGHENGIK